MAAGVTTTALGGTGPDGEAGDVRPPSAKGPAGDVLPQKELVLKTLDVQRREMDAGGRAILR